MSKLIQAPAQAAVKTYTYEQALEASTKYFGEALPARVFIDKYALRDKEGNLVEPTPAAMHDRLANEFARIDSQKYGLDFDERFTLYRNSMDLFARIVPQGSPMAAIGNPYQIMSASNCVVIESPHDSIAGIMKTGTELAQLYKRRCGVGTDISTLRPDGFQVNNAARTTSGAWSFADLFSYITRMVGQSGRRGALMITLDVHHPDVVKFATMKQDLTKVTGANVSIRLSDEFLKAVDADTDYEQRWPIEGKAVFRRNVRARDVWKVIIESATKTAEPGLIFWDTMTRFLPPHSYPKFRTVSTNPCSEIGLSPYDSCRLISLNLTGYIRQAFTKKAAFDWDLFSADIRLAVQMCDNLVDLELELIDRIKGVCGDDAETALWQKLWQAGHDGRRTGVGTHGLGDALAQMNIKYDSEDAIEAVDHIYSTLRDVAYETSADLAQIRGPFPAWDWKIEKDNEFLKKLPKNIYDKIKKNGRRNIAQLTQAPTGSVSIISKCGEFNRYNVSSGVEPVFRNSYTRRKKITPDQVSARVDFKDQLGDCWQEFPVFHPNVKNYLEKICGFSFDTSDDQLSVEMQKKLLAEKLPEFFVTSDQISWQQRVQLQGVEQEYIDHSISSTINLPKGTTADVVGGIYLEAWKQGLKGVTVYVDESRTGVLVTDSSKNKIDPNVRPEKIVRMEAPKRPSKLPCEIHHVTVDGKKWAAMVGLLNGEPYELFMGYSEKLSLPAKYKGGILEKNERGMYTLHVPVEDDELVIKDVISTFNNTQAASLTRMASMSLRHGVPIPYMVEQLGKDGKINDINKVIARILKKYIKEGLKVSGQTCGNRIETGDRKGQICGSTNLVYSEGCVKCLDCNYSKCN